MCIRDRFSVVTSSSSSTTRCINFFTFLRNTFSTHLYFLSNVSGFAERTLSPTLILSIAHLPLIVETNVPSIKHEDVYKRQT